MPPAGIETKIALSNGIEMPLYGFGMSHNEGGVQKDVLVKAIECGVRLYDTAARYGTESYLRGLFSRDCPRSDFFLTSKLWTSMENCANVKKAYENSCARMDIDSMDLYLVHWPTIVDYSTTASSSSRIQKEQRQSIWREMEKLVESDRIKSIGTSNFLISHLNDILDTCSIVPHVNQIEFNPFQNPKDLRVFCQESGIVVQGYCPFAKGYALQHPLILELSQQYQCTGAQLLLQWSIQQSVGVIPKTNNVHHLLSNLQNFEIQIQKKDLARLNSCHENYRATWDVSKEIKPCVI